MSKQYGVSGTISLLCQEENILRQRDYSGPKHRREIVENWKHLYGEKFYSCFLQISPYVDIHKVRLDGTNCKADKVLW